MKCEKWICLYNEESKCLLREITINQFGQCDSIFEIYIPEEMICWLKEKHRAELNETHARWESN